MENNILISLCMIVKNEAPRIERVLNSVKDFADEIIIVDTGSNDNTKELASKFTDKIYDFEWVEDFSRARNFSFSKANGEYIMWLDADDDIEQEDIERILRNLLLEFPVAEIDFSIPKWAELLPVGHWLKDELIRQAAEALRELVQMKDVDEELYGNKG